MRSEGIVSLVMPRSVHIETRLDRKPRDGGTVLGMGSSVALAVSDQDIEDEGGVLRLEMKISGLPWFGPSDFPVVLAKQEVTAAYQALGASPKLTANLGRQLQIAIPMILCLLALFFDHSRVFSALAYLSAARAASVFLHAAYENPAYSQLLQTMPPPLIEGLAGLLVGLGLTSMVHFGLVFTDRKPTAQGPIHALRGMHVLVPLFFLVAGILSPVAWKKADLVADAAAGIIVAMVLGYDVLSRQRRRPDARSFESVPELKKSAIEFRLMQVAGVVTFVLFALLGSSNLEALLSSESAPKTLIDWRFALFYPGLLFVAFLRVGTSSRHIALVASELTRKKVLEAELSTAKKQMLFMQGERKGKEAGVKWRAWQRQCVSVGGDFFDVRKLKFEDGELVVAVVLDVTGHGIQAAMIARSLSDAWATWCADATRARRREDTTTSGLRPKPSTREERESLLSRAPGRLLAHLSAAREPGSCTAIFALLDSSTRELTLCNAGHPSAMLVGSASHRTLTPKGKHSTIAGSNDEGEWTPNTYVLEDETLFLFSDGLFSDLLGVRPAVIAKRFRLPGESRTNPHDPKMLWKLFRMTQRFYSATHPEDEDDITLVAISLPKAADLSKVSLNQEPICLPKGA